MTDRDAFEVRFADAVHRYTGRVASSLDPVEFAHELAARGSRRHGFASSLALPRLSAGPRVWLLVLIGALLTGLLAGLLVVGSRPPEVLPAVVQASPGTGPTPRPLPPSGIGDLIHVTGARNTAGGPGYTCAGNRCQFATDITASDGRLSGTYVLEPTGSTSAGTWGTIGVCPSSCGWPWADLNNDPMTWVGEWFTAGARPTGLDSPAARPTGVGSAGSNIRADSIFPVDTIWLDGRGPNAGLTAVLRMWSGGSGDSSVAHIDGWVFPTPSNDPTSR